MKAYIGTLNIAMTSPEKKSVKLFCLWTLWKSIREKD